MAHPLCQIVFEADAELGNAGDTLKAGACGALSGAAKGSVVPVVGTIIGAFAGWIQGIVCHGGDVFAIPYSPQQSGILLAMAEMDPGILFFGPKPRPGPLGNEEQQRAEALPYVDSGDHAVGLVGFLAEHSGVKGFKSDKNGMSMDPQALSNPQILNPHYMDGIRSSVTSGKWKPSRPKNMTAAQAKQTLSAMRKYKDEIPWIFSPARIPTSYRITLGREVAAMRSIAGESGPDEALGHALGADVTPSASAKPHDAKVGEAPASQTIVVEHKSQPSRVIWFGLGAITFAGSLVGLVAWQVRKVQKKLETPAHKEH